MEVSNLIGSVKILHLHKESGIPLATLHRWKKNNAIPGKEPVQEFHRKRIEAAVRKLKRARAA